MSDEDTLRRAAAKVREISAGATPGPWQYLGPDAALTDAELDEGAEYDGDEVQVLAGTALASEGGHGPCHEFVHEHSDLGCEDYESDAARIGSAQWMALVNPDVAEPLAVVFDSAADDATQVGADWQVVQLARALLGEQAPA